MDNISYLKNTLEQLKKTFPHHWRVQSFSKTKPQATVMAYIDARDCMDLLDAHCVYGWHREHYLIDNKVYCRVGIVMPDATIQWRSDCGTESVTEKEKGQSSDSFKRACVNFGVGRFLYDLKVQYLKTNLKKESGNYPYIIDEQGSQIWDLTTYINNKNSNTQKSNIGSSPIVKNEKQMPVPQDTLDAISSAKGKAELTKIYTDCTGLHNNEQFKSVLLAKQNEIKGLKTKTV